MADTSGSSDAYLVGGSASEDQQIAYLVGGSSVDSSILGFMTGDILLSDSTLAFLDGEGSIDSSAFAYVTGIFRGSLLAFLEGSITGDDSVANDYIWLKDDAGVIEKKFKVVAQDYDDGTPEKSNTLKRTLGGGLSQSVGAVYWSWTPTIRVRHTESEADFGDLQDLTDLFELTNPNGTPSNKIIFIDHHNVQRTVLLVGDLRKSTLGSQIEGGEAWSIVRLRIQELPNA